MERHGGSRQRLLQDDRGLGFGCSVARGAARAVQQLHARTAPLRCSAGADRDVLHRLQGRGHEGGQRTPTRSLGSALS